MGGDLTVCYEAAFSRLAKSKFRSRLHLSDADRKYIADKGLETVRSHYEIFIKRLTALQMRVLATLASKGRREVFSVKFLSAASVLNAASVKRAIDRLVSDGLIFYNDREYRFVNPFFREWVKRL